MLTLNFLLTNLIVLLEFVGFSSVNRTYPPRLERERIYSAPSEAQKRWALATCAILTESNGRRHDLLGGCERTPVEIKAWKESLIEWWDVHDREELLKTLKWIECGGHRREFNQIARIISVASDEKLSRIRQQTENVPSASNRIEIVLRYKNEFGEKSIIAWDFSRYISLCGWGYIVGYLTEDEAWGYIMPVARLLQKTFTSWEDLGKNHVIGREFWSLSQTQKNGARTRQCYEKLKCDPASPWRQLDWDMNLSSQR